MWRTVLGILSGLVAWIVIATLLDIGLRYTLPGYLLAEPALAFTLVMMIARLSLALLASLGAGATASAVAPASRLAPWLIGLVLLGLFIPEHIRIGARLPLWYHLFFLLTLAPCVALGARLRSPARAPDAAPMTAAPADSV